MSDAFSDGLGGRELTDAERDRYVLDNIDVILAECRQAVTDRDDLKEALVDAVARGDAYRDMAHNSCDWNRYPFLNAWPSDGKYFGESYTPPFGDEDVEQYRTNARAKVKLGP